MESVEGMCIRCGKFANLICSKCFESYCSSECQILDWKLHKTQCLAMPALAAGIPRPASITRVTHNERSAGPQMSRKDGSVASQKCTEQREKLHMRRNTNDEGKTPGAADSPKQHEVKNSKMDPPSEMKGGRKVEAHREMSTDQKVHVQRERNNGRKSHNESIRNDECVPQESHAQRETSSRKLSQKTSIKKGDDDELCFLKMSLPPSPPDMSLQAAMLDLDVGKKDCYRSGIHVLLPPLGTKCTMTVIHMSDLYTEGSITAICPPNKESLLAWQENLGKVNRYANAYDVGCTGYAPTKGEVCLAIFNEDKMWYRAMCIQELDDDTFWILFIDYGNKSEVKMSQIMAIPDELLFPTLAVRCFLKCDSIPPNIKMADSLKVIATKGTNNTCMLSIVS